MLDEKLEYREYTYALDAGTDAGFPSHSEERPGLEEEPCFRLGYRGLANNLSGIERPLLIIARHFLFEECYDSTESAPQTAAYESNAGRPREGTDSFAALSPEMREQRIARAKMALLLWLGEETVCESLSADTAFKETPAEQPETSCSTDSNANHADRGRHSNTDRTKQTTATVFRQTPFGCTENAALEKEFQKIKNWLPTYLDRLEDQYKSNKKADPEKVAEKFKKTRQKLEPLRRQFQVATFSEKNSGKNKPRSSAATGNPSGTKVSASTGNPSGTKASAEVGNFPGTKAAAEVGNPSGAKAAAAAGKTAKTTTKENDYKTLHYDRIIARALRLGPLKTYCLTAAVNPWEAQTKSGLKSSENRSKDLLLKLLGVYLVEDLRKQEVKIKPERYGFRKVNWIHLQNWTILDKYTAAHLKKLIFTVPSDPTSSCSTGKQEFVFLAGVRGNNQAMAKVNPTYMDTFGWRLIELEQLEQEMHTARENGTDLFAWTDNGAGKAFSEISSNSYPSADT